MALKIGITGGIGSGKSVVCNIFKCLNVPVFEADMEAKEILNNHHLVKPELVHLFGSTIYTPNGTVDRKKLASIIFNDDFALQKVNQLIHPLVREQFIKWSITQQAPYVLHEAAILIESGFYKMMDKNILVIANKDVKINRIIKRDQVTKPQVLDRMAKQWDDNKKQEFADKIIYNTTEMLIPQVLEIHEYLLSLSKSLP